MRILFTNDDGINAHGINALAETFASEHEVFVVAPDSNRSAFSHSLTIFKDLFHKVVDKKNFTAYSTTGTPADCVKFAILYLMKNNPPDIVISGINDGPNLGSDIMYSGTVAAACEAAYLGIPSIAISLNYWNRDKSDFMEAAQFLNRNLKEILAIKLPLQTIININYPITVPFKGVKVTKTGMTLYSDEFTESESDGGLRLKGKPLEHNRNDEDCDVEWSKRGYATITPIKLDRTDYTALEYIKSKADIK